MKTYTLTIYDGRGHIKFRADSLMLGMLKMYCLTHLKGKQTADIIDSETGEVVYIAEARGNSFPKVTYSVAV